VEQWIDPELAWFLVGLVLLLAELVTPGFVIIFFGVGAWITALLIALGLTPSFNAQLLTFMIASVVSLVLFRKKGKSLFEGRRAGGYGANEVVDSVVGEKAVVVADIAPHAIGKVEFNGSHWQAEADVTIPKGTTVTIVERKNLTLIVKPL
jgi:membrane protein implicated in regulation of membrane protease activity